jgi:phage gp36-like protein
MANPFASITQFLMLYDARTTGELSNDNNSRQLNQTNLQFILDLQASELDATLNNRYDLTSIHQLNPMPLILTKYVLASSAARVWARRTDLPKQTQTDISWADGWLDRLRRGADTIPGIDPQSQPILQASNSKTGCSEFDYVYGTAPSPTSPPGPQGYGPAPQ